MRRRRDCCDDTEWRVFFEHYSIVAAPPVWMEPLNTGNEFDDLQLFNFVVESANLSLFQLDASPFIRIGFSHRFHDFDDFCSGSDSFLFQLQKSFVSCCACLIRILKDAMPSTPD